MSLTEEDKLGYYLVNLNHVLFYTHEEYTCLRGPRPSGAMVVVAGKYPIYGYVRPPMGMPSCIDEGECIIEDGHCVRNLHAEVDAIISAGRKGIRTEDGIIYSINKPCYDCSLHIIRAGIKTIVYAHAVYAEERTTKALETAGVEVIHVEVA